MKRKRVEKQNLGYKITHKPGTLAVLRLQKNTLATDLPEILQRPDVVAIPYEQRGEKHQEYLCDDYNLRRLVFARYFHCKLIFVATQGFLKRTCIGLGLSDCGSRVAMINRLEMHAQGKAVVTSELANPNICEAIAQPSIEAQQAPIYARGEMGWLGLPHDVIRYLLQFASNRSLLQMLRVCKYLCRDVFYVLKARAEHLFGTGATPLAISVQQYFMYHHWRLTTSDFSAELRKAGFYYNDITTSLYQSTREQLFNRYMKDSLVKYGSVDGVRQNNARLAVVKQRKREERTHVLVSARVRFDQCQALCQRLDIPNYIHYDEVTGKLTSSTQQRLWFELMGDIGLLYTLKSFIRQERPTLARLETRLVACQQASRGTTDYITELFSKLDFSQLTDTWSNQTRLLRVLVNLCQTDMRIDPSQCRPDTVLHRALYHDAPRFVGGYNPYFVFILDANNVPTGVHIFQRNLIFWSFDNLLSRFSLNVPGNQIAVLPNPHPNPYVFTYDSMTRYNFAPRFSFDHSLCLKLL